MKLPYEEFDLSQVRTYPLQSRSSKVNVSQFARPHQPGGSLGQFIDGLPHLLAGGDFRAVVAAVLQARRGGRPIIWGFGAHVVKTGLSPLLVDLMRRGFVSALATNGAGLIHDFELALAGATSEDVDGTLGTGAFGMATETGAELNRAITDGVAVGLGLGQSAGRHLAERRPPHVEHSVFATAAALEIPVTVHVALGTDIIHMHPAASGAAIGEGSLQDFRFFASSVAQLEGGVFFNCGSAVILPEVFLKAVALARNAGRSLDGLTTVNLDFVRHYRPQANVVVRPTAGVGRGYSLVGHHELLIPLLAAALVDGVDG